MGSFAASLKALGDTTGLQATVSVSDGRLSIEAANQSIGDWHLKDIRLEPIPLGYRMTAEGDQIVIEMTDVDGFADAISGKRQRFWRKKKAKTSLDASGPPVGELPPVRTDPGLNSVATPDQVSAQELLPEEPATEEAAEKASTWEVVLRGVDGALGAAESRFGNLLPHWVFTRMMLAVVLIALLLAIIFPTAVSIFLLVSGLLIVVFGAVVYTDPMLMARWLPGRMQPMHVLLFGVVVLLLGVLLGVIGN